MEVLSVLLSSSITDWCPNSGCRHFSPATTPASTSGETSSASQVLLKGSVVRVLLVCCCSVEPWVYPYTNNRKTWQAHITHVDQVLHLLSEKKNFLKESKSSFGIFEVEYFGHIVGKDEVRLDPKKIEAMYNWPHLKSLKIMHNFLGLM
jgi:hypothetical protein